jgi:hypothetical protein
MLARHGWVCISRNNLTNGVILCESRECGLGLRGSPRRPKFVSQAIACRFFVEYTRPASF